MGGRRRIGGIGCSEAGAIGFASSLSLLVAAALPVPAAAAAEPQGTFASAGDLKKLSLEDLMEIEVTLVSRKAERLTQAPSAIQVITSEEIRRSGATTLAEALRLASNLQVARVNSRDFAITARGLNQTLANKLLVMIDGRTIYTPLYAGVFWDMQHIALGNVDRIEVISGPGGTLWGGNAVNGIINIVSLPAADRQGLHLEAGGGTFARDFASATWGGRIGAGHYRVMGHRLDYNSTLLEDGTGNHNGWGLTRGGIRVDIPRGERDRFTVHAEIMGGVWEQSPLRPAGRDPIAQEDIDLNGQFLQARWQRVLSPGSDFRLKGYVDRTYRNIPMTFEEDLLTYDLDFQHRFGLGAANSLVWGAGARMMRDRVTNGPALSFLPADRDLYLLSGFLQDELSLLEGAVKLTAGTKVEHNDYSGLEIMPSGRAAWSPDEKHTLWAAVSRAIRSPSRIDVDFFIPTPPVPDTMQRLEGGPGFGSETLIAYETGWRTQPWSPLGLSLAGFAHRYDRLRILEQLDPVRFRFTNGTRGVVLGLELAATLQATAKWRLKGGYTFLHSDLEPIPGHVEYPQAGSQGNDPGYQLLLQSWLDLPRGFELNACFRLIDELPDPQVDRYASLDLGAAWHWEGLEISLHGMDLLSERHPEFGPRESGNPPVRSRDEIPRSVKGRVAWRL